MWVRGIYYTCGWDFKVHFLTFAFLLKYVLLLYFLPHTIVELAKQSGRKWADDSEATSCITCKMQFSMTNRKHHCRNCGQIFCKDCSTKKAQMEGFKNPQRVCDNCYAEIQQNKWHQYQSVICDSASSRTSVSARTNAAALSVLDDDTEELYYRDQDHTTTTTNSLWDEQVHWC